MKGGENMDFGKIKDYLGDLSDRIPGADMLKDELTSKVKGALTDKLKGGLADNLKSGLSDKLKGGLADKLKGGLM
jgi:hypothetical protein